jgi:hypothetical protein
MILSSSWRYRHEGDPRPGGGARVVGARGVEDRAKESLVDSIIVMDIKDQLAEIVLLYWFHFVFTMVDSAGDSVSFVVVHGVAH